MTPTEYQKLAMRTEAPTENLPLSSFPDDKLVRLFHAMMGLISESGEIADTIKKHVFYNQELDEKNLVEEIGDICWYLALACNTINVDFANVLTANIEKLKVRFPEKFSTRDAKEENRDRKKEMSFDSAVGRHQGFEEAITIAEEVADLMDGQNKKEALKMIQRRINALLK